MKKKMEGGGGGVKVKGVSAPWKTFWGKKYYPQQTNTAHAYTQGTHCRSCRFSFTVCIHPFSLALSTYSFNLEFSLLEEHPSFSISRATCFSLYALWRVFRSFANFFSFWTVLCCLVLLDWTELADPRWNQLIREMNFEIRTNAHRVSVISTSVSILFRVFFIISVPPGCFRDWPPPPPPFWTACFVWRVHVLFIHTLGFRHVVCVCVYTH
jgi:hypothetical protein